MKDQIQLFNFEGQQFRALSINGEPYFVGKDVAVILGYQNGSRDIRRHVDEEDRKKMMVFDGRQSKETIVINESGLYSLILSSKMPKAKEFKHKVTSEVLPSIRKQGYYMTDAKAYDIVTNKDSLARMLIEAGEQLQQKNIQIEEMKPKALFADSVATSKTTVLVGELAKILRGNGVDIGATRLFAWMRKHGYLINRKGTDWNMPTQKSMNMGLFKIKETSISHSNGSVSISKTPKVTGKGQQYFINKFLKNPAEA